MDLPWTFLLVSAVGLAFTANALRPLFAPAPLAVASFFAGWLTAELALHHLAWQSAVTAAFAWGGALASWPGLLGLAATLLSWAGLVLLWRRSLSARLTVDRSLREGLGSDYEERIAPELRKGLEAELEWPRLLLPLPVRAHREVERIRDLHYHEEGRLRLRLDVWRHRARPAGCPVLLFVHGGGWVIGKKDYHGLPLLTHLAARGWVCFGINYRLSPRATFPEHLVDVKRAIAWVRRHGGAYGADPDFLVVSGGSAGGHLAALAALTPGDPEYQPGFETADTRVSGCVPFYGIYDLLCSEAVWPHPGLRRLLERHVMKRTLAEDRAAYLRASPIARIHPDAPPFFVIHGRDDTLVPVEEARRFTAALRAGARAPVAYAELAGAQHAFEIFPSVRTHFVLDGVARFCAAILSARRAEAAGPSERRSA